MLVGNEVPAALLPPTTCGSEDVDCFAAGATPLPAFATNKCVGGVGGTCSAEHCCERPCAQAPDTLCADLRRQPCASAAHPAPPHQCGPCLPGLVGAPWGLPAVCVAPFACSGGREAICASELRDYFSGGCASGALSEDGVTCTAAPPPTPSSTPTPAAPASVSSAARLSLARTAAAAFLALVASSVT